MSTICRSLHHALLRSYKDGAYEKRIVEYITYHETGTRFYKFDGSVPKKTLSSQFFSIVHKNTNNENDGRFDYIHTIHKMTTTISRKRYNGCSLFVILGCIISLRNSILVLKQYYVESTHRSSHVNDIPTIQSTTRFEELTHKVRKDRHDEPLKHEGTGENRGAEESSAGCLLIMDDNHFLIEWIAYHYHVIHLRHLIIAIDPRSQTFPDEIVERWRDHMNISVWYNYNDFHLPNHTAVHDAEERVKIVLRNAKEPYNYDLIQHRARQRLFYSQCMIELQRSSAHRGWTLFLDTDEFVSINYPMISSLRPFYHLKNISIPTISEPGSVLTLLQLEQKYFNSQGVEQKSNNITSSPCVQIPRTRYGTMELPVPKTIKQFTLPSLMNTSHYATLRWQIHAKTNNYGMNRISKTIIDLDRISSEELYNNFPIVESIHKPLPLHCTRRKLHIRSTQQILVIHHYLGTYEQYTFRKDSRSRNERSDKVRIIEEQLAFDQCAQSTQINSSSHNSSDVPYGC